MRIPEGGKVEGTPTTVEGKGLTGRVVGGAVEAVFLAGDDTWVADATVVEAKLLAVVGAYLLVEYLRDTVNGGWLQDAIVWSHILREVLASEDCDRRRQEQFALIVSGNVHCGDGSIHVNIEGQVRVLLSACGQDSSQMDDVVDLLLLDEFFILLSVSDVELHVLAAVVALGGAHVGGSHTTLWADLLHDGAREGHANLSVCASDQHLLAMLN